MLERILWRQRQLSVLGGVLFPGAGFAAFALGVLVSQGSLGCLGLFFFLGGLSLFLSRRDQLGKLLAPLAVHGGGDAWRALRRIDAEIAAGRDVEQFGEVRSA